MTTTVTTPSTTRRTAGSVLRSRAGRLAAGLTTPLLPTDYLGLASPLLNRELTGRVEQARHETFAADGTPTSVSLTIHPGRGWAGHTAGQYVRLGVEVDGVLLWRAYSLTTPPAADGRFTVTTKAIPGGVVSNHLVRRAQPGSTVRLAPADGEFTLPATRTRPLLMITAGSGLTPVMGMLRTMAADRTVGDVVLLHSAPTEADVLFRQELEQLAATTSLRLHVRHTDAVGMLALAELGDLVPDWEHREAYVCGPTGLMDAAEAHWAAAGQGDWLHTERFRPRVVVTEGDGGAVGFTASGVTTGVAGATSLLDAGEAAGALLPSGCRMGVCFGCVGTLRSGAVRDLRSGDLTQDSGATIQTCVSTAVGDCQIEL